MVPAGAYVQGMSEFQRSFAVTCPAPAAVSDVLEACQKAAPGSYSVRSAGGASRDTEFTVLAWGDRSEFSEEAWRGALASLLGAAVRREPALAA